MNSSETKHTSDFLTHKELRRYALQIESPAIGVAGQEKIKKSSVLVIGAGGKGTSALENLVSLGVGKIGISDNYPVKEEELSRQHLYGSGDLGKQKAIVARQKLKDINHSVEFQLHNVCLSRENILTICESYDLLVDATDNYAAHCLINDAALKLNIPLIFGSVDGNVGYISVFNYMNGPSFKCAYPATADFKRERGTAEFSCQVALISIVGAIMANEAIKVILGINTSLSGDILIVDTRTYSFSTKRITRNPQNFAALSF